MRTLAPLLLACALASPLPAAAQSLGRRPFDIPGSRLTDGSMVQAASVRRPPAKKQKIGIRAYGLAEVENLRATRSFEAVLGTARLTDLGAGADVVNLWKGAFARFAVGYTKKTGTRVFVDSSQKVFPQNVPLTVKMTPLEVCGGWRFAALDRKGRFVPYLGAGGLLLRYQETSTFALTGEDIDSRFKGGVAFGGLEVAVVKFVNVAIEGLYRHVPKALGAGGVSSTFSENNLGGGVVRFRFGVGF